MNKTKFDEIRISHFPRSVIVVTSKNIKGEVGATTISWNGVLSSQPPVIGVSFLPDSFTRNCIIESREFVINVPDTNYLTEVNYLGSISGSWEYKLSRLKSDTGKILSLADSEKINTPRIKEFYLNFECRVINALQIGLYDCFLGLVLNMFTSQHLFSKQAHKRGAINYKTVSPIFCLADEYWCPGESMGISTENKIHPHGETH